MDHLRAQGLRMIRVDTERERSGKRGISMGTTTRHEIREGMTVFASDREKIGGIASVQSGYFVIQKGWLFPEDVYVPESAIDSVDMDDNVYLNLPKDDVEVQEW